MIKSVLPNIWIILWTRILNSNCHNMLIKEYILLEI